MRIGNTKMPIRATWARFKGTDQGKRVGESCRWWHVCSGEAAAQVGGNVLLLDEPANDLIETLRALENALLGSRAVPWLSRTTVGSLDRIATHILDYGDEGKWSSSVTSPEYEGTRKHAGRETRALGSELITSVLRNKSKTATSVAVFIFCALSRGERVGEQQAAT